MAKTISCRAAIAWSPGKITIETIEVDPPKAEEVRVKIVACSICGSDNHILHPANAQREALIQWPAILGHEAAGVIESIGDQVTGLSVGDHVVCLWQAQCGECQLCKGKVSNFCWKHTPEAVVEKWVQNDGTTRISCRGQPVYRYLGVGAFAKYVVIHQDAVAKVDADLPLEKICLFGCGIPTGYGSSTNVAKVFPGAKVAIWGLGGVGLAAVKGAKDAGAGEVIGVDTNPKKFELAKKMGCTQVINPLDLDKSIVEFLKAKDGGRGLDIGIDCVGSVKILETIMEVTKPWGTCTVVGVVPPDSKLSVTVMAFIRGKTLTGGDFGGFKGKDAIKFFVDYYKKGFPLDDFITKTIGLDQVGEGLKELKKGEAIRTVVVMK